jgi:hypothetical protein
MVEVEDVVLERGDGLHNGKHRLEYYQSSTLLGILVPKINSFNK